MFEEEFVLWPVEGVDDHRAEYISEELKIRYMKPWITDGYTDLVKCFTHEWIHGLIDWALHDKNSRAMHSFKNQWDQAGESAHFIVRLIHFD